MKKTFKTIWLLGFTLVLLLLVACGAGETTAPGTTVPADPGNSEAENPATEPSGEDGVDAAGGSQVTANPDLTVGFLYNGAERDGGYTESHFAGAALLQSHFGSEVRVIAQQNVSTTDNQAIRDATSALIAEGATVVVATNRGYRGVISELAASRQYENIVFLQFAGDKTSKNLSIYTAAMEEPVYLTGMLAGLQTRSNKIGFVAISGSYNVHVNVNAFALGVRAVNPTAVVNVAFVSKEDDNLEKQAASGLGRNGCDVIAQYCYGTGPLQGAQETGSESIGYITDQSALAPYTWLTAPIWHQEKYLIPVIEALLEGNSYTSDYYGTLKNGYLDILPLNSLASPEAYAKVMEARTKMLAGNLSVFVGPVQDNAGNTVIPAGKTLTRSEIAAMDYYVEGVNI